MAISTEKKTRLIKRIKGIVLTIVALGTAFAFGAGAAAAFAALTA